MSSNDKVKSELVKELAKEWKKANGSLQGFTSNVDAKYKSDPVKHQTVQDLLAEESKKAYDSLPVEKKAAIQMNPDIEHEAKNILANALKSLFDKGQSVEKPVTYNGHSHHRGHSGLSH